MPMPKKTPEEAKAAFNKSLFRAYRAFIIATVRAKYPVAAGQSLAQMVVSAFRSRSEIYCRTKSYEHSCRSYG